MGATNFIQFCDGKTAREAFGKLVSDAEFEFGHSPYNGTISTTQLVGGSSKIADKWGEEAYKAAVEFAELDRWGRKWESRALDCGEFDGGHMWAFYGWAAC